MLRDLSLAGNNSFAEEDEENSNNLIPMGAHPTDDVLHVDRLDDIFGSAPSSPALRPSTPPTGSGSQPSARDTINHNRATNTSSNAGGGATAEAPSDIPRLRSVHVTSGYREGIAVSKEKYLQEGFDEGYSLGGEIGREAGRVIGVLEGLLHRRSSQVEVMKEGAVGGKDDGGGADTDVVELLRSASEELSLSRLFSPEFFGEDGVWVFPVVGEDTADEEPLQVTFADVAVAHPIVRKWRTVVSELLARREIQV
jgi:hypothetical protein